MVIDPTSHTISGKSQIAKFAINKLKSGLPFLHLLDLWRILHPTTRDLTVYSVIHKSYSRINYLITSHNILNWQPRAFIGTKVFYDQALVFISIKLHNSLHPISVWWLNNYLLRDLLLVLSDIRAAVIAFIYDHASDPTPSPGKLEFLKCVICGRLIPHGVCKEGKCDVGLQAL